MKRFKGAPSLLSEGDFTPADFAQIIQCIPEDCVLVGGQAVAWWTQRYGLKTPGRAVLTSSDIDFWGSRADLMQLAKCTGIAPVFPHEYEMTVWVGALPFTLQERRTLIEMIHTVPGLDTNDPGAASVEQLFQAGGIRKTILVLTPVSLVLAKLHALRHFDQKQRQDELHLRLSLEAVQHFVEESVRAGEIRHTLWNCNRLIDAHHLKFNRKLEQEHAFRILDAIPIEGLRRASENKELRSEFRQKLQNFCTERWPRLGQ